MAANTLAYTLTELRRWVAREIGKDRTYASNDATGQTDIGDAVKAGLHQFYWPPNAHQWSFLQPTNAQLELHGAYETGTISSVSTSVTLTGGTWPSWAAQGELWADGAWHTVATRSSDSVIVLDTAPSAAFSVDTYSLRHREYDLPDDFGGLLDPFTYRVDQYRCTELTRVNEALLRSMESYPGVTGTPTYFCITSVAPTSSQESKARAIFTPQPEVGGTTYVWYRYSVVPPLLDGSTYVYAHGGAEYHETMKLSCLDKALQMLYGSTEKHAAFLESLESASRLDKRKSRPQTHGHGAFSDGYSPDLTDYRLHRGPCTIDTSNL